MASDVNPIVSFVFNIHILDSGVVNASVVFRDLIAKAKLFIKTKAKAKAKMFKTKDL